MGYGVLGVCLLSLVGFSKYQVTPSVYKTEQDAAVMFYYDNLGVIGELSKKQELLGWVVKCQDGFHNTTSYIGTTKNILREDEIYKKGCIVTAALHTHPDEGEGWTADFFSEGDLSTSYIWNVYLMSQENCYIRVARKSKNKHGVLLGKIDCK